MYRRQAHNRRQGFLPSLTKEKAAWYCYHAAFLLFKRASKAPAAGTLANQSTTLIRVTPVGACRRRGGPSALLRGGVVQIRAPMPEAGAFANLAPAPAIRAMAYATLIRDSPIAASRPLRLFLNAPLDALRSVLQQNSLSLELIPDLIGQGEILVLSGLLTLLDQSFHLGVQTGRLGLGRLPSLFYQVQA